MDCEVPRDGRCSVLYGGSSVRAGHRSNGAAIHHPTMHRGVGGDYSAARKWCWTTAVIGLWALVKLFLKLMMSESKARNEFLLIHMCKKYENERLVAFEKLITIWNLYLETYTRVMSSLHEFCSVIRRQKWCFVLFN